jgi:cytochrome oxidase Cu insertion factor (SCO1/SenC/PrrC family)
LLWAGAAFTALLAVAVLWMVPRLQPATGTVVVVAAGRVATSLPATTLSFRQGDGTWVTAGSVSGGVPAAPDQQQLIEVPMATGRYDAVRLGGDMTALSATVTAGQVEPVLLGIDSGRLVAGAAYAGNDQVNLGLGELAGKFVPMPAFDLVDQAGRPINLASFAGKDVVIAAFHTTCHETCPLYTALFLQLAKNIPSSVMLAEVTTDPSTDTPAVLSGYAKQVGASWTFATGTPDNVAAFWKPFGVELSSGDVHTSSLVLVDRHGYIRLVYRGVPNIGNDIPPSLDAQLSAAGLRELASHGDGWGAPDVLQALTTIAAPDQASRAAGTSAPGFTLASTDGGTQSLAGLEGKPLVINFWRTDCPPCRAEMPLLQQQAGSKPNVRLVLVNWGESADAARTFLDHLGIRQGSLLDSDLSVGRSYGVAALPTTFFVRSDGIIDRRQIGELDQRVLAAELSNLGSQ